MDKWWLAGKHHGADRGLGPDARTSRVITQSAPNAAQVPVVYFALAVGGNLVKIGTVVGAERVEKRMAMLQPGCPYDLKVLLVLPGYGRREEARLHRLFAAQAFRSEWFRCDGELKELLLVAHVEGVEAAISYLKCKNI